MIPLPQLPSVPPSGPHAPLAAQLEARGPALSRRALDRMYQDPFWWARFGARGRRFAEEDSLYHVAYLVHALRVASSEPLERYARWLQRVLTTRGMCSRHLADDWGYLSDEISADAESPDANARLTTTAAPALAYLRKAQEALVYETTGPARELQLVASAVAARAVANLGWTGDGEHLARANRDLAHLLSYAADALALSRPAVLLDHARWTVGFWDEQGRPAGYAGALFSALTAALSHDTVAPATRDAAGVLLADAARAAQPG